MKLKDILPLVNQETICLYEVDSTQDDIGYYDLNNLGELVAATNFAEREVIYMYPCNDKYDTDNVLNIGLKQESKTNEEIFEYLNSIDTALVSPFADDEKLKNEIYKCTDKIRELLKQ